MSAAEWQSRHGVIAWIGAGQATPSAAMPAASTILLAQGELGNGLFSAEQVNSVTCHRLSFVSGHRIQRGSL